MKKFYVMIMLVAIPSFMAGVPVYDPYAIIRPITYQIAYDYLSGHSADAQTVAERVSQLQEYRAMIMSELLPAHGGNGTPEEIDALKQAHEDLYNEAINSGS